MYIYIYIYILYIYIYVFKLKQSDFPLKYSGFLLKKPWNIFLTCSYFRLEWGDNHTYQVETSGKLSHTCLVAKNQCIISMCIFHPQRTAWWQIGCLGTTTGYHPILPTCQLIHWIGFMDIWEEHNRKTSFSPLRKNWGCSAHPFSFQAGTPPDLPILVGYIPLSQQLLVG